MKNEQKFIFECIHAFLGDYNIERLETLYQSTNHKKLNLLIINQNLEGFFYHLYLNKIFKAISIPNDTIQLWKKVAGKNSLSNAINDNETFKIVGQLVDHNIDYIYIKGLSTRYRCYADDYIKRSSDIDILIKKADYEKVKNILLSNGYEIPYNHYIKDFSVKISFKEYENRTYEISFLKRKDALRFIIDLQWDFTFFDKSSLFHRLYNINSLYQFDSINEIKIDGYSLKVFPLEIELINISFHFVFNHGFKGTQWLIDVCTFIKKHEIKIDFDHISKITNTNLRKLIGLMLMLSYEFDSKSKMDKEQKKLFCVDKLLPFEYRIYKSMLSRPNNNSVLSKLTLRIVKILLPYKIRDRLRVIKYFFFNTDSISHRLDRGKKIKNFLLPFSLIKLFISDILKKRDGL